MSLRRFVSLILVAGLAILTTTFTAVAQRRHTVRRVAPLPEPAFVYAWPESTPEEQGLDSGILSTAIEEASSRAYTYSLVVIRHGKLVTEGYFHGTLQRTANHIHSASKSFTSAIVGIAIDRGYMHLDDKVLDWFPEYATPGMDPRKYDITVDDLLTMTAGFDWVDDYAHLGPALNTSDLIRFTLDIPLRDDPGTRFNYCTLETDLLSAIVTRATGMPTSEFAREYLLDPLGIRYRLWVTSPRGYPLGGRGMFYTPRDMARLGYLYLHDGLVDGRRLVPASWVETSISRHETTGWDWGALKDSGYGYQWWLGDLGGHSIFYASGKGGQFILCFPDLDMIVVTTTNGDAWGTDEWLQIQQTMELVADFVLSAVTDGVASPPYYPADARGERIEQSASMHSYVNRLTWTSEPKNASVDITGYRIYEMKDGDRQFLVEVDANTFEYETPVKYDPPWREFYAVTTVSPEGESLGAIVSVR